MIFLPGPGYYPQTGTVISGVHVVGLESIIYRHRLQIFLLLIIISVIININHYVYYSQQYYPVQIFAEKDMIIVEVTIGIELK